MKVAAEIREGLKGDPDAGEFTGQGYRDGRFDEDYPAPERYVHAGARDGLLLLVLFLVFGLPLAGTIVGEHSGHSEHE